MRTIGACHLSPTAGPTHQRCSPSPLAFRGIARHVCGTDPFFAPIFLVGGFILGHVLFGAATIRAGLLAAWSAFLMIIGVLVFFLGELSFLSQGLPASVFQPLVDLVRTVRPIVLLGDAAFGVGFASMGYALWSERRAVDRADLPEALARPSLVGTRSSRRPPDRISIERLQQSAIRYPATSAPYRQSGRSCPSRHPKPAATRRSSGRALRAGVPEGSFAWPG